MTIHDTPMERYRSPQHPAMSRLQPDDIEFDDARGNHVSISFLTTFGGKPRLKCVVSPPSGEMPSEIVLRLEDADKLADLIEACLDGDSVMHPQYYYDAVRSRNRLVTVSVMSSDVSRYILLSLSRHTAWLPADDSEGSHARQVMEAIRSFKKLVRARVPHAQAAPIIMG